MLGNLAKLILTLYGALIVFALVALVPAALIARVPIRRFIRAAKDPALIAFTTTSSDAALPLAMERMVEFGVPRRIVAFVMPTGYSFNLDGSTLYLGGGFAVRGAGGGHRDDAPHQLVHDADPDDHQQGSRGRAPRLAGDPVGRTLHRSACRSRASP